jgi:hypothetical protein
MERMMTKSESPDTFDAWLPPAAPLVMPDQVIERPGPAPMARLRALLAPIWGRSAA